MNEQERTKRRLEIARQENNGEKTVGEVALEEMSKAPDSMKVEDYSRNNDRDYLKALETCVRDNYHRFEGDFFIEVITKREKILENVVRNLFASRHSCPTPNYDQSVFKYNHVTSDLEYIWTVPDRETCYTYLENHLIVEEKELLEMVKAFANGILLQKCRELNGEVETGIKLKKTKETYATS